MNYLDFAKQLAYDAGAIMEEYFLGDTQTMYKDDKSPVTVADTLINQMVIDRVAEEFPEHSVRGEEQSSDKGSKYVWVCDPIDGTSYYSMGVALGTFMIALVINGQPEIAVIYEPVTNKLYAAAKGKGARMNNERIRVSKTTLKQGPRIDVTNVRDRYDAELRSLDDELHKLGIRVHGLRVSGLMGAMVADGSLAAGVTTTIHPHDIAAVKLIVEEAGGKVTSFHGEEQRYDRKIKGAVISNGLVHDEIVSSITKNN